MSLEETTVWLVLIPPWTVLPRTLCIWYRVGNAVYSTLVKLARSCVVVSITTGIGWRVWLTCTSITIVVQMDILWMTYALCRLRKWMTWAVNHLSPPRGWKEKTIGVELCTYYPYGLNDNVRGVRNISKMKTDMVVNRLFHKNKQMETKSTQKS